jgi:hypothetical protein
MLLQSDTFHGSFFSKIKVLSYSKFKKVGLCPFGQIGINIPFSLFSSVMTGEKTIYCYCAPTYILSMMVTL